MLDRRGSSRTLAVAAVAAVVVLGGLVLLAVVGAGVVGFLVLDSGPDAPDAGFEFDRDGGDVVIAHAGGESLDGDVVWVAVDGSGLGTWSDFEGGETTIDEGDSVRVRAVSPGAEIALRWSDGGEPVTIASYEVPEGS